MRQVVGWVAARWESVGEGGERVRGGGLFLRGL